MTDFIKVRETIEYEIRVAPDETYVIDEDSYYGERLNERTILKEEIGRRHEVDYVIGVDMEKELHFLTADGKEVFSSRSHDAVVYEWAHMTGTPVPDNIQPRQSRHASGFPFLYGDLEDPNVGWDVLSQHKPLKES